MAQPARVPEHDLTPSALTVGDPQAPSWSGEVHGPVAAMHQAIRDRLDLRIDAAGVAAAAPDPVEVFLRRVSRATGWGVLLAAFAGVAALIA